MCVHHCPRVCARIICQANATAAYFKAASVLPAASFFNRTSRGFPDVAAQAVDYIVIANMLPEPVAGTSCMYGP